MPLSTWRYPIERDSFTSFFMALIKNLGNPLPWWAFRDSNPGPIGYEPTALTN